MNEFLRDILLNICLLALVVIGSPILLFVLVKLGSYAFYLGKMQAERDFRKGNGNGEDQEEGP